MREIRLYGSEGGGAVRSPYPYQTDGRQFSRLFDKLTFFDGRHRFLRHLKLLYEFRSWNHPLFSRPLFLLRVHHE